ncbi:hypothetical protein LOTGIDRAFT_157869 [Lottia gigantea]|uniref:Coiled-coil domain-containing protein 87 n=1 Tax=Lottia gigantea TaxID=225164 RepID=V4CF16_LOTGI|nr:hypothetical protein LOTGIDRAFT_157869 [Lottia gigantea]ESP00590.1 hypothetical protein LOTGIDRAFT_157869 [Lottia gigantea]
MPSYKFESPIRGLISVKEEIKLPKYQPSSVGEQPVKSDDMYSIKWPSYNNNDVEKRIENVLGPLSLFAPFPHEDEPEYEEIELERPVTPINEEIKVQPYSFEKLAKYLRRRIAVKSDVSYLSVEDQKDLSAIIMAEVSNIWPDIRRQIDDPFLTPEENKELNRRIAVHIVTVAEKLFQHYIQKAKVLNERGVFSGPANMSRLKAQLALDSNKFFNILMIRRYIVKDIRGANGDDESPRNGEVSFLTSARTGHAPTTTVPPEGRLTYQGMINHSRPKSKLKKHKVQSVDQQVKEMTSCMPSLDTRKLLDLVADLPERGLTTPSEDNREAPSRISETESRASYQSLEEISRKRILQKRSESMGNIMAASETLLEEMGFNADQIRTDQLLQSELDILEREKVLLKKKGVVTVKKEIKPGTREYITNDLQQLISKPEQTDETVDEELPPLLQAITRNARHDDVKVRMEKKMKELEEEERKRKEDETIVIRKPTQPQPATISSKISDKLMVKTSDVRVSERVCMSSIVLDKYSTVYNDLLEEIDPAAIISLDKNLFLSEEIREVYKEINKTIPNDHLTLDADAMFMNGAENINFTGTMASASLQKKPSERVINPKFTKDSKAPWGTADPKTWANIPEGFEQYKNSYKEEDSKKPNMNNTNFTMTNTNPTNPTSTSNLTELPPGTNQKISSWLTWWKNTVTSDDYMKYLSTQETDYLGALYHFYDSDDEDDVDGMPGQSHRGPMSRSSFHSKYYPVESKERQEKRKELQKEKEEYNSGYWNVKTVLLGGLGRDPLLDENTEEKEVVKEKPQSAKTLSERAAAARQAKASVGHSRGPSAFSKSTVSPELGKMSPIKEVSPQDRLEKVWTALLMPDNLKLDMAIKYSCNKFFLKLPEAIDHWEHVTESILKRETLIEKLEKFERKASDPNRFFEKGHGGSSVKRLEEAKNRSFFYKKIDQIEGDITKELDSIRNKFQDEITYGGRLYVDKMKWDRIEMLYWLQEERKEHGIKYEAAIRELPLKLVQLEPLHST